jgi:hypothetical protein
VSRPADYLQQAERFFANREELPDWLREQHDAADRDLRPLMDDLAQEMRGRLEHRDGTPEAVAFGMAMAEAIRRRRKKECIHVALAGESPPPLIADLASGVISCQDCLPAVLAVMEEDRVEDSRCDVCDGEVPNNLFTPTAIQAGPFLVYANLCDDCAVWPK